ncbi:MAG TPA: glycosyltransferase family 1 protein [Telluria sp.]
MQKFGGATTYWNEVTSRLPQFVPGKIISTSGHKYARLYSPRSQAKVFHSSHFRVSSSRATSNVTTIHDLIYEKGMGGGRGKLLNLYERRKSVARADAIICISESTRRDLHECYGSLVGSKPVHVIHHGCTRLPVLPAGAPSALTRPDLAALGLSEGRFFIFVGGRGGYKNFALLLRAFVIGGFARQGLRIVCTGAGLSEDEQRLIAELGLGGAVSAIGFVDAATLGELYEVARALVYPSAYEGFGLPPLEAMAAGCPVICANSSSLPEVVGDSGLLIDPGSAEELAEAMKTALDATQRARLADAGQHRAELFDWDTSARAHAAVYRSLAPF